MEELEDIPVGTPKQNRTVKIGAAAPEQLKETLRTILRNNLDVFAWSHEDMPGIDTRIAAHYLNIDREA